MDAHTDWQEKISFFMELGKPLSKAKTIRETIDVVMYQVGLIFEPVNWSLLLKDSQSPDMVFAAVVGSKKDKLQGLKLPRGEGIAGHIYTTGKPLIVKDVKTDKRFSGRVDRYTGFETRSIIGVPLKTGKTVFGVIELINKISGDKFTAVDLQVLTSIAEYAAIAIERSYYYQSLKKMALYDPLTGLKNKASFNHTLSNRAEIFDRYEATSALLIINIQGFRKINKAHGHQAGDRVLVQMARILNDATRKVDENFRYDADKFIVLMPHTDVKEARRVEERIRNRLEYHNSLKENTAFEIITDVHSIENQTPKKLLDMVHGSIYRTAHPGEPAYSDRMEDHIHTMLDEEKEGMTREEKKAQMKGRQVKLKGSFITARKTAHGDLTVLSVSTAGISFETTGSFQMTPDDLVNVTFTLDNAKRSVIKRQILIKTVEDRYYEGVFYNPPPYDKDFGFYLIG